MSLTADRLNGVEPPATLAIAQQATQMKAAGADIISLSMGEPDFSPPENVKEAATAAIRRGESKYGPIAGIPELRAAISRKFERDNNLTYHPSQTIVSTGGKQTLFNAFFATLNPGDEVIIPTPCWVSYPDMVRVCGGAPVFAHTGVEDGFLLTPEGLEEKITKSTRWLVLNSPSNPSGAVYSLEQLRELGEVLLRHPHVWVLTDDIYEHMVYSNEKFHTMAEAVPELYDRVFTMNGVSKAYAMPGWRIGYGAGPRELISAMEKAQGQITSATSSISQWAAKEALDGLQDSVRERREIYRGRRDLALKRLTSIELLTCSAPDGAFYIYPSCEQTLGRRTAAGTVIRSDADFALALLNEKGVAVVPGTAFMSGPQFRISYAGDEKQIEEACLRIAEFCEGLTT